MRTGSITWQLDRGLPLEVVAERVNAAPETIRRFYDKGTAMERLQKRRREYTADFDIHDRDPSDDEDRADRDDSATESETDDDGDDNGDDQQ